LQVNTKTGKTIEVEDRQKISIPRGLFGFEDQTDYVIFDAEQEPFYWLQSVDVREIAFILINPFLFRQDYELNIESEELADLGIDSPEKALVFAIVTVPEEGPVTANLQGPLIINKDTKVAKQAILGDSRWKTKHDIVAELAGSGK